MMRPDDRAGVALMLVLWLLVGLGALATGVAAVVRGEARVVANVRARSVARYAAESGVVAATQRLKTLVHDAATLRDKALIFRRLDDLVLDLDQESMGDARFQVAVADLNARVDLNQSGEAELLALFRQFVDHGRGTELNDALQDWKDDDDERRPSGAEIADYAAAGSRFIPPNRPLQRLDELTRIRGFTDDVTFAIAPYVTVRGDGRVNMNTAPEPVLAALPGVDRAGAELVASWRAGGDVFESVFQVRDLFQRSGLVLGVDIRSLTTVPRRLLIVSRGWQDGHPLTHEIQAVYDLDGLNLADGPRLNLISWTERDL